MNGEVKERARSAQFSGATRPHSQFAIHNLALSLSKGLPFAIFFLFLLTSCALQPVTEPRTINFANEPTPLPPVAEAEKPTYIVRSGTILEELTLRGRVGSAIEQPLLADQDGIVSAVLIQNDSTVITGDVIALLSSRDLDEQITAIQRELQALDVQSTLAVNGEPVSVTLAEARLTRAQLALQAALERGEGSTATEISLLEADIEIAELELSQIERPDLDVDFELRQAELQAELDALQAEVATRKLIATGDGDLTGFALRIGSRVQAGNAVGQLVRYDQPLVWADANEGELGQLEEGMAVKLALPNNEGDTFDGVIVQLPFPHGSGSVRDGAVGISSAELPPFRARVDVKIILSESNNSLWLPPAALREFADQNFVIVRNSEGDVDDESRVDVVLGLTSPGRVEILSGLAEGDIVVAP